MSQPSLLPTSLDQSKIAMTRAQMPAVTREVYLNTGTNGPLSRRTVDAITSYARDELVTAKLQAKNIVIRHVPQPLLNRIATGFFNTEEDIHILVQGIRSLLQP